MFSPLQTLFEQGRKRVNIQSRYHTKSPKKRKIIGPHPATAPHSHDTFLQIFRFNFNPPFVPQNQKQEIKTKWKINAACVQHSLQATLYV
jgi:hypothetical protein